MTDRARKLLHALHRLARGRAAPVCIGLALCVAIGVVYFHVFSFPFVDYDDEDYVVDNTHVNTGLSLETIHWAFTSRRYQSNWHPITWLSHALDVELFGLEAAGHHATNILLHGINALLVFGLLRSTTGRVLRSGLVAALFALHPLRVESVAWVSERKDLLSALFGLLAIRVWCVYARRGGLARYGLVALFQALSLMSKPMLVTLPCVLLLLDLWPLQRAGTGAAGRARTWRFLVLEKLPLLALSVVGSAMTLLAQSHTAMEAGAQIPFGARLANSAVSYVRYLGKSFWPSDLSVLYAHPALPGGQPWAAWQVAGALALLAAISAAIFWLRRPAPIVGWLWFLGTLIPAIGWVQVGYQAMADRYTYFPSIGLSIAVVWAAGDWLEARPRRRLARGLAAGLAVCALAMLMVGARQQTEAWRDSLALYTQALRSEPVSPYVFLYRARILSSEGELQRALTDLDRALAGDPRLTAAYNNRGAVYARLGDPARALADLDRALEIGPARGEMYLNRARILRRMGAAERALADYGAALAIGPSAQAHVARGELLYEQGDCAGALADHAAALELDAGFAAGHMNLAWVLATCADPRFRDGRRAIDHATRGCELADRRGTSCIRALAAAHAEAGDLATADRLVREAIERDPRNPMLQQLLRAFESGRAYRVRAP